MLRVLQLPILLTQKRHPHKPLKHGERALPFGKVGREVPYLQVA
jgi:hypothetical protein